MKRRRKRDDDDLAVLVVNDGSGPIAFTLPFELAPEARVPGLTPSDPDAPDLFDNASVPKSKA